MRLFFLKNLSKKGVRLFFRKSLQKSPKMVDFPLYNTLKTRFFSRASRAEFLRGALIFLRFSDPENLGVRLLISENQPKRVGVRLLTGGRLFLYAWYAKKEAGRN